MFRWLPDAFHNRDLIEKYGDSLDENDEKFRTFTEKEIFKNIQGTLNSLNIVFDIFSVMVNSILHI